MIRQYIDIDDTATPHLPRMYSEDARALRLLKRPHGAHTAGILYRFRERRFAATTDIEEMFLQIRLTEADQPEQMFLWRENSNEPPRAYKMRAMLFNATGSPFLMHRVRNKNVREYASEYLETADVICNSHCMEAWKNSVDTAKAVVALVKDLKYVHAQAKFNLLGWSSNREQVQATMGSGDQHEASAVLLGTKSEYQSKSLGLL
ncbi:hypothetical protein EVAR_11517_1 [Eumeta japonica]|uniref:Uncharacterized protein n=1 Tax=Eumeta variegata TaxID=151549 RepID=A0A4C1TYR1_EUMVA|nr:hypothetical protein EVAR_11517_1 [Eumeta japonica]